MYNVRHPVYLVYMAAHTRPRGKVQHLNMIQRHGIKFAVRAFETKC